MQIDELGAVMEALRNEANEEQLKAMIAAVDVNETGKIEFDGKGSIICVGSQTIRKKGKPHSWLACAYV